MIMAFRLLTRLRRARITAPSNCLRSLIVAETASFRDLLLAFGSLLLFEPGPSQRVHDAIVPFVASMFEDRSVGLSNRRLSCPWRAPCRRIVDGETVHDRLGVDTREALGHFHPIARSRTGGSCEQRILAVK